MLLVKRFVIGFAAAIALTQSTASADVTSNLRSPLSMSVFVPCANGGRGETVVLSGDLHTLAKVIVNGNAVRLSIQNQPQGISGVGIITGAKYQGTGVTRDDFSLTAPSFPANFTTINNVRIIGQGNAANLSLHENTHFTINANGRTTAVVDNFRLDCK